VGVNAPGSGMRLAGCRSGSLDDRVGGGAVVGQRGGGAVADGAGRTEHRSELRVGVLLPGWRLLVVLLLRVMLLLLMLLLLLLLHLVLLLLLLLLKLLLLEEEMLHRVGRRCVGNDLRPPRKTLRESTREGLEEVKMRRLSVHRVLTHRSGLRIRRSEPGRNAATTGSDGRSLRRVRREGAGPAGKTAAERHGEVRREGETAGEVGHAGDVRRRGSTEGEETVHRGLTGLRLLRGLLREGSAREEWLRTGRKLLRRRSVGVVLVVLLLLLLLLLLTRL
jgi:hypothetical protein